jgi:hypothetical protein
MLLAGQKRPVDDVVAKRTLGSALHLGETLNPFNLNSEVLYFNETVIFPSQSWWSTMNPTDPIALFRLSVLGPLVSREKLARG